MSDLNNDIINYHNGKLTPKEMHALERKALDDPFLAEALEGASQISSGAFSEDLMALSSRLNKETHKTPVGQAPPSQWTWPLRIAAGLVIAFSATVIFFALRYERANETLALNEEVHSPIPIPEQSQPSYDSVKEIASNDAGLPTDENSIANAAPGAQTTRAKKKAPVKDEPQTTTPSETIPAGEVYDENISAYSAKAEEQLAVVSPQSELSPAPQTPVLSKSKAANAEVDKKLSHAARKSDGASAAEEKESTGVAARQAGQDLKAPSQIIKGQVFDVTGTGLPGVNVLIKGTDVGTVTDATGKYEIVSEKKDPTLVYSFIGYSSHEVETAGKKEINISLDEDISQLSEVVVTGYGIAKEESDIEPIPLELASPVGGRRAYKQYLEKNLQYPELALGKNVEGKVTIQFAVEPSGQLSDFRVIKGIGDGCDEEVIRLIKSGPKWNPTKRDTEKLRGTVRVKMRFQLPKRK